MYLKEIIDEFGIDSKNVSSDLSISESNIPKQHFDGFIYVNQIKRCKLVYKEINNQGRYGLIQKCYRVDSTNKSSIVVVKRPRSLSISLAPEGIIQALCFKTITKHGLYGSIPKPYDIFIVSNEVRYSMEYIDGMNLNTYLNLPGINIEKTFLNCLMQLCFILYVLEIDLHFDHRDLRIENIWIRPLHSEKIYSLTIDGKIYKVAFKFQVILLDFGFACIGNFKRRAVVNLGNEVFSPIDPCPKIGRDMYQFLNSFFENKQFHEKFSREILEQFKFWMKPYTIINSNISYLITQNPAFENKYLQPIELIRWFIKVTE